MGKMCVYSVPTEQLQWAEELNIENIGIICFLLTLHSSSQGNRVLGLH